MKQKIKFAIYARVSTDFEEQQKSFESQMTDLEEAVKRRSDCQNFELVARYGDFGISGTTDKRPEFQKMISDALDGQFEKIVTKSISRFARNYVILKQTVDKLTKAGIEVIFIDDDVRSFDTNKNFIFGLLGLLAEEESNKLKERIKSSFEIRRAAGKMARQSAISYGFKIEEGHPTIDEEEAKIVRQIFQWFVEERLSTGMIAKKLNQKGIPSRRGSTWSRPSINYILTNKKNIGIAIETNSQGKPIEFEGIYPPIVDRGIFDRAQEIMTIRKNSPKSQKMREKTTRNFQTGLYALSGICFCDHCGGKVTRYSTHTENTRRVLNYEDPCHGQPVWGCLNFSGSRSAANFCKTYCISETYLYSMIIEAISYITRTTDYLDQRLQKLKDGAIIDNQFEAERKVYLKKKQALEKQRQKTIELFDQDIITMDEVKARQKKIEKEISKLVEPQPPTTQINFYKGLEDFLVKTKKETTEFDAVFILSAAFTDPDLKRQIIKGLIEKITIGGEPKYSIRIKFFDIEKEVKVKIGRRSPITRTRRITSLKDEPFYATTTSYDAPEIFI